MEGGGYDNVIKVDVAKQRNGPTGPVKLTFQKEYTRFRDYVEEDRYSE
jgi:replicative DNA helicase